MGFVKDGQEGAKPTVRVFTYNVLSSALSTQAYYPRNDPNDLNEANRYQKLLDWLDSAYGQNAVVCLQEVSRTWADQLALVFRKAKYDYYFAECGNQYNDYMGVLTAWPMELYQLTALQSGRLTEAQPWQWKSTAVPKGFWDMTWSEVLQAMIPAPFRDMRMSVYPRVMDQVRSKFQRLLCVCLMENRTSSLVAIANFHAPCMYWSEPFGVVEACMVSRVASAFARNCAKPAMVPLVLVGDFNMTPKSLAYKVLTEGNPVDPSALCGIETDVILAWEAFSTGACFQSAYVRVNEKEPEFTNKVWTAKSNEQFCDTLDYIFCTYGATAIDVVSVPNAAEMAIMPNEHELSDHLWIGATIEF